MGSAAGVDQDKKFRGKRIYCSAIVQLMPRSVTTGGGGARKRIFPVMLTPMRAAGKKKKTDEKATKRGCLH